MSVSCIVWDRDTDPPASPANVLCWSTFHERLGVTSVPRHVEDHADRLRSKYLAFIYDLGESELNGRRIVDHLNLGDGLSWWWLTLLAEKSPLKSPRIYCCIRLFALEEMLVERKPSDLQLVSADSQLADAMRTLCDNLNIPFAWRREPKRKERLSVRAIFHSLPYPMQGMAVLARHFLERWAFRRIAKPSWFSDANSVFMCSYFLHLDRSACEAGHFYSRQWGRLPELLHRAGRRTNWLQHFMRSPIVADSRTAVDWVRRFNRAADAEGNHAFLDTYLSLAVVIRAFTDWLRLNVVAWRLRRIRSMFRPKGSALSLWPILRSDWWASVRGSIAATNCFWIELFDAALRSIPRQSAGFYLCENQGWERAMLHAWRKHGHGEIIGVQHATAPFWHLYYFDDPRNWSSMETCRMPMPDRVAVNGPDAWKAFLTAGYPVDELVKAEALRYIDLATHDAALLENAAAKAANGAASDLNVLILGDMIPSTMDRFLTLVEDACELLPSGHSFTFKPHPGYHVELSAYLRLRVHETTEPLDRIVGDYDIIIAANSTSAAVEAFVVGVPAIIMLDGLGLNLSPLRGKPDVEFVSTPEQLAGALARAKPLEGLFPKHQEMFYLDAALPRWRQLLASVGRS